MQQTSMKQNLWINKINIHSWRKYNYMIYCWLVQMNNNICKSPAEVTQSCIRHTYTHPYIQSWMILIIGSFESLKTFLWNKPPNSKSFIANFLALNDWILQWNDDSVSEGQPHHSYVRLLWKPFWPSVGKY